MQSDGVIGRYAIGGAVGATFYLEPVRTLDVDVFIAVHAEAGKLVALDPIYEHLMNRGYSTEGQYVVIERSLLQFLSAGLLSKKELLKRTHSLYKSTLLPSFRPNTSCRSRSKQS